MSATTLNVRVPSVAAAHAPWKTTAQPDSTAFSGGCSPLHGRGADAQAVTIWANATAPQKPKAARRIGPGYPIAGGHSDPAAWSRGMPSAGPGGTGIRSKVGW